MTPCIDLADPAVCADPLAAYRRAQAAAPVVTLTAPGLHMHAITRHREARAMLTDPRFAPSPASYAARPDVPDEYRPYLRTMQEQDGPGHLRLRRAVAPAFTPRRVERYRARIAELVDGLLADIPTDNGRLDLLNGLARPLPMAVICAVIGVPAADRPRWHGYGAMVSAGDGKAFAAAIPAIIDDAKAVLGAPEDGLVTDLVRTGALDDTEIVTLIWHLVLAARCPPSSSRSASTPSCAALTSSPPCRNDRRRRGGAAALVRPAAARGAPLPERGRRRRRACRSPRAPR